MQSQKSNHFMSVGLSKDFLRQNNQKHVLKETRKKWKIQKSVRKVNVESHKAEE